MTVRVDTAKGRLGSVYDLRRSRTVPMREETVQGLGDRTAYVVDGFFDAHVHVTDLPDESSSEFLRSGITLVRDLGGDPSCVGDWTSVGTRPCVAMYGGQLDRHPLPHHMRGRLGAVGVRQFADVLMHIERLVDSRAAGIKLYTGFPSDLVRPCVEAAHASGLVVAHHVGTGSLPGFSYTSALDAARSGVDSIEHIHSLTADLLGRGALDQFLQDRIETVADAFDRVFRAWSTIDPENARSREAIDVLVTAGTVLVPTLNPFHFMVRGAPELSNDSLLTRFALRTRERPSTLRAGFDSMLGFVAALHSAGGQVAVGTDTSAGIGVGPHVSYRQELRCFREAGIDAATLLNLCTTSGSAVSDLVPRPELPDLQVVLVGSSLDDCLFNLRVERVVDTVEGTRLV